MTIGRLDAILRVLGSEGGGLGESAGADDHGCNHTDCDKGSTKVRGIHVDVTPSVQGWTAVSGDGSCVHPEPVGAVDPPRIRTLYARDATLSVHRHT